MKRSLFLSPLIFALVFLYGCKPSNLVVREKAIQPYYVQTTFPGHDYIWHKGDWIKNGNTYIYHQGFWIRAPKNHSFYAAGQQSARTAWIYRFPDI